MSTPSEPIGEPTRPSSAVKPNGVIRLILTSFAGAFCAGILGLVCLFTLSPPGWETPPDDFFRSTGALIIVHAMVTVACVGGAITSVVSLLTLRRAYLSQSIFVVGGAAFVAIGLLFPFARALRLPDPTWMIIGITTSAMLAATLYCRKHFPIRAAEPSETAGSIGDLPKSIRLGIATSVLCLVLGYGALGLRPNQNLVLIRAVQANDLEAVRGALRWGANLNYNPIFYDPPQPTAPGTPLTTAILSGHREMFFLLVGEGAPLYLLSFQEEMTPLIAAAHMGDAEITKYLLDQGMGDSFAHVEGMSAYEIAVEGGHSEVTGLLQAAANEEAK